MTKYLKDTYFIIKWSCETRSLTNNNEFFCYCYLLQKNVLVVFKSMDINNAQTYNLKSLIQNESSTKTKK